MASILDTIKKMLEEHKRLSDKMKSDLNPDGSNVVRDVLDSQRPPVRERTKPRRRRRLNVI